MISILVHIFWTGLNGTNLIKEVIRRKGYPIRVLVKINNNVNVPLRLYNMDLRIESFFIESRNFKFGSVEFMMLLTPQCRIEQMKLIAAHVFIIRRGFIIKARLFKCQQF